MLSALQQLYRAIITAPGPGRAPGRAPGCGSAATDTRPERGWDDQLQFKAPLTVTAGPAGRPSFKADARTTTCLVRHTGVIRPCQMRLVALHGNGETFSIRLTDRQGGCVQLAAHIVDQRTNTRTNRASLVMTFQGLTDHLDESHRQLSHSGAMSGKLELRGRLNDPASWTCRLTADYFATPDHDAAPVKVQPAQPQHAA